MYLCKSIITHRWHNAPKRNKHNVSGREKDKKGRFGKQATHMVPHGTRARTVHSLCRTGIHRQSKRRQGRCRHARRHRPRPRSAP